MPRLVHRPGSRSTRVLWLLEEIGAPFDLTLMTDEYRRSPEHFANHPLGRVPFMELDDGTVMFESQACCLFLADAHADAGLIGPAGSTARALAYQWSAFAYTEVESVLVAMRSALEAKIDLAPLLERFGKALKVIADALGDGDWLVDDEFGVADVLCVGVLGIAHSRNMLGDWPTLSAYVERAHARPAYERMQLVVA